MSRRKAVKKIIFYLVLLIVCFVILFPFLLLFSYSLRTSNEIFSLRIKFIPRSPTLQAYKNALLTYAVGGSTFRNWILNSLIVCGFATLSSVFISSLCGYGISRFKFLGRKPFLFIVFLTQTVPWVVVSLPFYIMISRIGMVDRLSSLAVTYLAILTPVSTWLFTGFFKNIPLETEEAARIDGCSHLGVYYRIILPLSVPGISAIALFAFVLGWSDYLLASIILKSVENWTIPLGLTSFQGEHHILWAEIMAMSTIVTIPIVVLFLYLQRYLINLMAGGLK